jgi:hypothetical protein
MNETELKALIAQAKKLTARVEAWSASYRELFSRRHRNREFSVSF